MDTQAQGHGSACVVLRLDMGSDLRVNSTRACIQQTCEGLLHKLGWDTADVYTSSGDSTFLSSPLTCVSSQLAWPGLEDVLIAEVDLKNPTGATYQRQVQYQACVLAFEKCFPTFNLRCQQACLAVDLHLIVSSSLLLHVF